MLEAFKARPYSNGSLYNVEHYKLLTTGDARVTFSLQPMYSNHIFSSRGVMTLPTVLWPFSGVDQLPIVHRYCLLKGLWFNGPEI